MLQTLGEAQQFGVNLGILVGVLVLGLVIAQVGFAVAQRAARRRPHLVTLSSIKYSRRPASFIFPLLLADLALPAIPFTVSQAQVIRHVLGLALVAGVAWLLINSLSILNDFILEKYRIDVKDNLRARKIYTQFRVLRAVVIVVVAIVALAVILMSFDQVRQLGVAIATSAGIAGIVVGLAAQSTLSNLLASLQLALTEPIRLDDVVVVENDWGRIEEITLTYVVVCIWDQRRLILPISYFTTHPFENWTRVTADILGTVYLYVDYTVPLQPLRDELTRVVKDSPLWDGKVCALQVTDASERTVQLRALVSAGDSSAAWDLRCAVREQLVTFVQQHYPEALPRLRADFVRDRSSPAVDSHVAD